MLSGNYDLDFRALHAVSDSCNRLYPKGSRAGFTNLGVR